MKPFRSDVRHWRTLAEFTAHLAGYPPTVAPWARGVVLHHTWSPVPAQWRGLRSMVGLRRYYRDDVRWVDAQGREQRGWEAGPHLFVVLGGPDPAQDGIWQLTALNETGVHAGAWNRTHWGVEVVGDYDHAPWPGPLRELVSGISLALLRWRGLPVDRSTLRGHRECGSTKSCPGWAIDLDRVRSDLARQR